MKLPILKKEIKFPGIAENFLKKENTYDNFGLLGLNLPSVNISDEEKEYKIKAVLPGFDKKDVNIKIENNCLIISSKKENNFEEKAKNFIRKEYSHSSFERVFNLPENADENKIKAKMRNGILTVKIGKKKGYKSHKKTITVN